MQRRSTGIKDLDKHLNGGVPPGALLLLTSHSQTQAELFTHTILSQHDDTRTHYLTTLTTESGAAAELQKTPVNTAPGSTAIHSINPDEPIRDTVNTIRTATTEQNNNHGDTSETGRETRTATTDGGSHHTDTGTARIIIIDTITDLEHGTERSDYQDFLAWLQALQRDTGTIVLLTRYTDYHASDSGHEHVTNRSADAVWELSEHRDDTNISTYLYMPKCRFGNPFTERWKVNIDTEIRIDTSRDIA
ncbi:DUF7125 family protein [Halorubrum halodurans]|uniref:KaiC-like domain-containing protein n=1 Tax=Halorubrum halodurans TaxID=1383851 RepID=A0A256IJB0_9EURY|nr:hypothetical protein [Halorubrum halodurans]OYR56658.1 hypothetical protein DJ70_08050 [Halorubrum halodurans]